MQNGWCIQIELVLDGTVSLLLKGYRERQEHANGAGYRKLTKMLRRDHGNYVNKKKIYRIFLENELFLEQRSKCSRPARRIARNRIVIRPNQFWEFDLKYGNIDGERRLFFIPYFIDIFLRHVVGNQVRLRFQAGDLRNTLARALPAEGITAEHGLVIRSDNGPQMAENALKLWLAKLQEKLSHEFIPVRTPNKNAHIESFFSILELEFLSVTYFKSFEEA